MGQKNSTRCERCGTAVITERFINRTFYLSADHRLYRIHEGRARAHGCYNCLQILEAHGGERLEKAEFADRVIYTLRPTLFGALRARLLKLLGFHQRRFASVYEDKPASPKPKENPHAATK